MNSTLTVANTILLTYLITYLLTHLAVDAVVAEPLSSLHGAVYQRRQVVLHPLAELLQVVGVRAHVDALTSGPLHREADDVLRREARRYLIVAQRRQQAERLVVRHVTGQVEEVAHAPHRRHVHVVDSPDVGEAVRVRVARRQDALRHLAFRHCDDSTRDRLRHRQEVKVARSAYQSRFIRGKTGTGHVSWSFYTWQTCTFWQIKAKNASISQKVQPIKA